MCGEIVEVPPDEDQHVLTCDLEVSGIEIAPFSSGQMADALIRCSKRIENCLLSRSIGDRRIAHPHVYLSNELQAEVEQAYSSVLHPVGSFLAVTVFAL